MDARPQKQDTLKGMWRYTIGCIDTKKNSVRHFKNHQTLQFQTLLIFINTSKKRKKKNTLLASSINDYLFIYYLFKNLVRILKQLEER